VALLTLNPHFDSSTISVYCSANALVKLYKIAGESRKSTSRLHCRLIHDTLIIRVALLMAAQDTNGDNSSHSDSDRRMEARLDGRKFETRCTERYDGMPSNNMYFQTLRYLSADSARRFASALLVRAGRIHSSHQARRYCAHLIALKQGPWTKQPPTGTCDCLRRNHTATTASRV
jgi:hypothetical protein